MISMNFLNDMHMAALDEFSGLSVANISIYIDEIFVQNHIETLDLLMAIKVLQ